MVSAAPESGHEPYSTRHQVEPRLGACAPRSQRDAIEGQSVTSESTLPGPDDKRAIAVRVALRTALVCAGFSFPWIVLSDHAMMAVVSDRVLLGALGIAKGLAFAAVIGLLLYAMLRRELARWEEETTARLRAEQAARENEARYRSLFENMVNGLAHCQMLFEDGRPVDFVYLNVNKAFAELTGLKEVVGKKVSEAIPGIREADPELFEIYGRVAATGRPERFETYVTALGQWFSIAVYCPVEGQFVAVFDAITERKKTEENLRYLSRVVEQSPIAIVITDPHGAIEYVNAHFTEMTGYTAEDVLGKTPRVLKYAETTSAQFEELWRTVTAGGRWCGDFCNRKKNGEMFWERATIFPMLDGQGKITRYVGVKEDITERRLLEEQLRRSQRVEAIGALAGGIAHDLNNLLAPVLLGHGLLLEAVRDPQERQWLELIGHSAKRAADVVRQLLTFSRGGSGERVALEVGDLFREMRRIVEETFPRDITLRIELAADLPPVLGDATQLHQVLLNLCVNARDAMPDGGTLTLRAGASEVDAQLAKANPPAEAGPHVLMEVGDTGLGMTPEVIERIFDPFFTTKAVGKGSGLGLSTVVGIVRSHHGFVVVGSKPKQGATFRVYLPAARTAVAAAGAVARQPPRGQNELILVVDDEPAIAETTRLILERHGYRTQVATRGEEALAIFRERAREISLVLTDIMMPGMNGVAMLREMRGMAPDLKALVTSGIASDPKQADLIELGFTDSLPKPCERSKLLEAVRKAIKG